MICVEIKPGKNIIELNLDYFTNVGRLTIKLSNSSNNSNTIYFFDKKCNKIIRTNIEHIFINNDISNFINILCDTIDAYNTHIVYYCNEYKTIEYSVDPKNWFQEIKEYNLIKSNYITDVYIFDIKFEKIYNNNRQIIHKLVTEEFNNKIAKNNNILTDFPLSERTYDETEINSMIDVLLSDKLTMGDKVKDFEKQFANYIGSNHAIMVNSGSSANLLAMAVLTNFKFENYLKKGDKVIVPTICWSTSVWPILQMGLTPIFVDININTLNADVNKIEDLLKKDNKIKGMVVVHILGNSTNMDKLMKLKLKYKLILMEDTCESLGSKYNNKYLGTFAECGTFSFYFSHHITTVEGGMIVTNDPNIFELLKCLRAHGWSRDIKGYNNEDLDNRFCFINVGYNLRPMEIQAAMGIVQLKKLSKLNKNRNENYGRIIDLIDRKNSNLLTFFIKELNLLPAWFAIPFILNKKYKKKEYLNYLESNNISTRPIVTGNFTRQPIFKDLNLDINPEIFINAEVIHNQGFFIGLPSYYMSNEKIEKLVDVLLNYNP